MKTNFDVITESTDTLARFMHELDVEEAMNDNICRFCGQYEMLDGPVCNTNCNDGFKIWLEKEVSND